MQTSGEHLQGNSEASSQKLLQMANTQVVTHGPLQTLARFLLAANPTLGFTHFSLGASFAPTKPQNAVPSGWRVACGGASMAGFGAPKPAPPTFAEVCAKFKTRLPKDVNVACPCGSGELYPNCCQPYHVGERFSESPERTLRTRYSAFYYRLVKYSIESVHKSNPDYIKDKVKWAKKADRDFMFDYHIFKGLEIGEAEAGESDDESFLSFQYGIQPLDPQTKKPKGGLQTYKERSKFVRNKKGKWLYATGETITDTPGLRNRTFTSEKDLDQLKKDADMVQKFMTNPAAKKMIEEKTQSAST